MGVVLLGEADHDGCVAPGMVFHSDIVRRGIVGYTNVLLTFSSHLRLCVEMMGFGGTRVIAVVDTC